MCVCHSQARGAGAVSSARISTSRDQAQLTATHRVRMAAAAPKSSGTTLRTDLPPTVRS